MKNVNGNIESVKREKLLKRKKIRTLLIFVSLAALFFVSGNTFAGYAQTTDKATKLITKENFKNEPIEFLEIKSNEKPVAVNENFTQENDWLRNFTVKFKNNSATSIVYVSLLIGFPETEATGNRMSHFLKYGINPLAKNQSKIKPELLPPGETAELFLSAESHTILDNFLATRHHFTQDLTKIHLTIMAIYFDDGTHWSAGTVFRPDPNNPGKFVPVTETKQA